VELIGNFYLVCFVWVKGFGGLTCDFAEENEEKNWFAALFVAALLLKVWAIVNPPLREG
jgi:hypothetical protein